MRAFYCAVGVDTKEKKWCVSCRRAFRETQKFLLYLHSRRRASWGFAKCAPHEPLRRRRQNTIYRRHVMGHRRSGESREEYTQMRHNTAASRSNFSPNSRAPARGKRTKIQFSHDRCVGGKTCRAGAPEHVYEQVRRATHQICKASRRPSVSCRRIRRSAR